MTEVSPFPSNDHLMSSVQAVVSHEAISKYPTTKRQVQEAIETFINEDIDRIKDIQPGPVALLDAFKESAAYTRITEEDRTVLGAVHQDLKQQASASATMTNAPDSIKPEAPKPQPGAQAQSVDQDEPGLMDGPKSAMLQQNQDEQLEQQARQGRQALLDEGEQAAQAQRAAAQQQHQGAQYGPPGLSEALGHLVMKAAARLGGGPGASAQQFEAGQMQPETPTERADSAMSKWLSDSSKVANFQGEPDSLEAMRAKVDLDTSTVGLKTALKDENRFMLGQVGKGNMKEHEVEDHMSNRSKAISEARDSVASSALGQSDPEYAKKFGDHVKAMQDSMSKLIESLRMGLEKLLGISPSPSDKPKAPAPSPGGH